MAPILLLVLGFFISIMKGPILKGPRLTLCPICLADAPIFRCWFKDKDVFKFLTIQKKPTLVEEKRWIRQELRKKDKITWSIYNINGKLVGNCGVRLRVRDKTANFGIVIDHRKAAIICRHVDIMHEILN